MLNLLSSPRRVEILRLVWDEDKAAGEIHRAMPDVTFGAVSLQLKQLLDAGLVESRMEGRNRYYRAQKQALGPMAKMLEEMWADALWNLKVAAEMEQAKRGPKPQKKKRKSK